MLSLTEFVVNDHMNKSSSVSGFYELSPKERLQFVREFADLSDECALLRNTGWLLESTGDC